MNQINQVFILVFLILGITSMAYADDSGFYLQWGDLFPMCAVDSTDYNPIRCGCEFLVPNLHIGMITNMIIQMIYSFFLIEDVMGFIDSFVNDPVSATGGVIRDIASVVWSTFFPSTPEEGISTTFTNVLHGLIDWIFGVVTPFLVVILILAIEFIKTYLTLAIPFMLFIHLLREIHLIDSVSSTWGLSLAVLAIILMFFGSIWLLGSDLGLYRPLIIW